MVEPVRLQVEQHGRVATVFLTGPGGKAVMDGRFFVELADVFRRLGDDDQVRAIVVRGPSRDFSFGLDLREAAASFGALLDRGDAAARQELLELIVTWQASMTAVARCTKPTVAVVTGWCVGGGVDLIAACDVRIASADAVFSLREAKMAIVADLGSLQRLVGIVGDGHLRELALTGDDIDADRAERIGLVNRLLPDPKGAVAFAQDLAERMADNSPLVARGIKDVLEVDRGQRVDSALRYTAVWNSAFLLSDDLREALRSFEERRPPVYRGR